LQKEKKEWKKSDRLLRSIGHLWKCCKMKSKHPVLKRGKSAEKQREKESGGWVGGSVLILLVCLCINYPELRTLLGRGAARSRITGFIITCCRLLITENYERSRLGGDGGRRRGGWMLERKAPLSDLCFQLISVN